MTWGNITSFYDISVIDPWLELGNFWLQFHTAVAAAAGNFSIGLVPNWICRTGMPWSTPHTMETPQQDGRRKDNKVFSQMKFNWKVKKNLFLHSWRKLSFLLSMRECAESFDLRLFEYVYAGYNFYWLINFSKIDFQLERVCRVWQPLARSAQLTWSAHFMIMMMAPKQFPANEMTKWICRAHPYATATG